MLYRIAGFALALAITAVAWRRSRGEGGYFDREVYGMRRATHLRYAAVSLAFAIFFAITIALRLEAAGIALLALYAVIAVFYAASFLQGAADSDE
jgi:hypothetical protein